MTDFPHLTLEQLVVQREECHRIARELKNKNSRDAIRQARENSLLFSQVNREINSRSNKA